MLNVKKSTYFLSRIVEKNSPKIFDYIKRFWWIHSSNTTRLLEIIFSSGVFQKSYLRHNIMLRVFSTTSKYRLQDNFWMVDFLIDRIMFGNICAFHVKTIAQFGHEQFHKNTVWSYKCLPCLTFIVQFCIFEPKYSRFSGKK